MSAWPRSRGRLCTPSNELKWWTPWCRPYMPFWCWKKGKKTHLIILPSWTAASHLCARVHLRQAGEDGGAAGGAAAHRGEGVVEHQAALGQRAKVGGADHRVVIHLRLKAGIISWKRENNSMSSCAACRPYPHRPAKTIKPRRAEINIHEATVQKILLRS